MFIQTDKNSQYLYDIVKSNNCCHKNTKITEYPYSFAAMMKNSFASAKSFAFHYRLNLAILACGSADLLRRSRRKRKELQDYRNTKDRDVKANHPYSQTTYRTFAGNKKEKHVKVRGRERQ